MSWRPPKPVPTPKRTKLEANVIARKTNTHFAWFRIREKKSVSSTLTFAFLPAAAAFGAPERVRARGTLRRSARATSCLPSHPGGRVPARRLGLLDADQGQRPLDLVAVHVADFDLEGVRDAAGRREPRPDRDPAVDPDRSDRLLDDEQAAPLEDLVREPDARARAAAVGELRRRDPHCGIRDAALHGDERVAR